MDYIPRLLESELLELFAKQTRPLGLILAGVVGAGKTTLIKQVLSQLQEEYAVFSFSGDDTQVRSEVSSNSNYFFDVVTSSTQKKAIIFVDEVQKSEALFDAVKVAFDSGKISFIVSGSNPEYLQTVAKRRLQRRADFKVLLPFSLPEILREDDSSFFSWVRRFEELLATGSTHGAKDLVKQSVLELTEDIKRVIDRFLRLGGLPLAWLGSSDKRAMQEVRKVVERGFEAFSVAAETYRDTITVYLAQLHSREFGYQGAFQKTGLRSRDKVNGIIDDLSNHGYLVRKKPLILDEARRSYLSVFSFIDPGMVSYLTSLDIRESLGSRVEGYLHARLNQLVASLPSKAALHYFKPYTIGADNKLKFLTGEIDFVIKTGPRLIPIEVKAKYTRSGVDIETLIEFVIEQKLPFGIVLYGGMPWWDEESKILYWPFWLV